MRAVPLNLTKANAVVARWHRHNRPTRGGYFAVGVEVKGVLAGVAIVGRPVARMLDDGETVEVTRLCVLDGYGGLHLCSHLYGRCCRVARELGYSKVVTYTLAEESGASLKAAGFARVAELAARPSWSCPSRPRSDSTASLFGAEPKRPAGPKVRWDRLLVRNNAKGDA